MVIPAASQLGLGELIGKQERSGEPRSGRIPLGHFLPPTNRSL
jgi:hypothetical protein